MRLDRGREVGGGIEVGSPGLGVAVGVGPLEALDVGAAELAAGDELQAVEVIFELAVLELLVGAGQGGARRGEGGDDLVLDVGLLRHVVVGGVALARVVGLLALDGDGEGAVLVLDARHVALGLDEVFLKVEGAAVGAPLHAVDCLHVVGVVLHLEEGLFLGHLALAHAGGDFLDDVVAPAVAGGVLALRVIDDLGRRAGGVGVGDPVVLDVGVDGGQHPVLEGVVLVVGPVVLVGDRREGSVPLVEIPGVVLVAHGVAELDVVDALGVAAALAQDPPGEELLVVLGGVGEGEHLDALDVELVPGDVVEDVVGGVPAELDEGGEALALGNLVAEDVAEVLVAIGDVPEALVAVQLVVGDVGVLLLALDGDVEGRGGLALDVPGDVDVAFLGHGRGDVPGDRDGGVGPEGDADVRVDVGHDEGRLPVDDLDLDPVDGQLLKGPAFLEGDGEGDGLPFLGLGLVRDDGDAGTLLDVDLVGELDGRDALAPRGLALGALALLGALAALVFVARGGGDVRVARREGERRGNQKEK